MTAKDDAIFSIATYREEHKIAPVLRGHRLVCAFDGLPLDERKGGFVHSRSAIFRAQDLAGYVPVTRCRHRYIPDGETCNLTLGRHLREKQLRVANPALPPLHDFVE